jgi:two-component system sensor histidine kinase PhoQ
VKIAPVVARIEAALQKVYAERELVFDHNYDPDIRFPGDEGDLFELLGNVLDNAARHAAHKVAIRAEQSSQPDCLILSVSDDGPGLPAALRDSVLQRGVRADSRMPGQGIGLAVVKDILDALGGQIELHEADPQGLSVRMRVPFSNL